MFIRSLAITVAWHAALASAALAEPPRVVTPDPVIFLSDNLDEADGLGFCLDTVGRGLSDRLHAHSCKPRGGDVQFRYDGSSGHIASATFDNLCVELSTVEPEQAAFLLNPCSDTPGQQFAFDAATGAFHPDGHPRLCVAVAPDSRQAGPFMARNLLLEPCDDVPMALRQWTVRGN